jgi:hypothetical protein
MRATVLGAMGAALLIGAGSVQAATINVQINGEAVHFPYAQPTQIAGRVMIPLRGVLERLGPVRIDWRPARQEVGVAGPSGDMLLRIGARTAHVNGRDVPLDVPPLILNGTTMVPLRFVSENLGARVDWLEGSQTVYIATPAERVAGARARLPEARSTEQGRRQVDRNGTARNDTIGRGYGTARDSRADRGYATDRERALPRRQPANRDEGLNSPYLAELLPHQGAMVNEPRPEIFARFRANSPIDFNTVELSLNGRDVSRDAEITAAGVRFTPTEDLRRGRNDVRLSFQDTRGARTSQEWFFYAP